MPPTTRQKVRQPPRPSSAASTEKMPSKKHAREEDSSDTLISKKQYDDLLKMYQELRATKDALPIYDETSDADSIASKTHSGSFEEDFTLTDKEPSLLDVNMSSVDDAVKPGMLKNNTPKEKIADSDVKAVANAPAG